MTKSSCEIYCDKYGPKKKAILDMHFDGAPPSRIDKELDLPSGTARREVCRFWYWDKERFNRRNEKPLVAYNDIVFKEVDL